MAYTLNPSILPQIKIQIYPQASVFRDFAAHIYSDADGTFANADPALKQDVLSQILATAVEVLDVTVAPAPDYNYPGVLQQEPTSKADPVLEKVNPYFEACLEMRCLVPAQALLDKIVGTTQTDLSPADSSHRAKVLTLHFAARLGQRLRKEHTSTGLELEFAALLKAAIVPYVAAMVVKPKDIVKEDIVNVILASMLPGGADVFTTM